MFVCRSRLLPPITEKGVYGGQKNFPVSSGTILGPFERETEERPKGATFGEGASTKSPAKQPFYKQIKDLVFRSFCE